MNEMNGYSDRNRERQEVSKFLSGLKSDISFVVDAIAEQKYQNSFSSVVTLSECIQYFKDTSRELYGKQMVAGFVLSVKKNLDPRNENDCFIVIQGLVDKNKKPIVVDGETVSRTRHTRTIDTALIRALDGKETGIFME